MALDIFSLNGTIRPISEAQVPITNIEYAYGFGVYETLRVVNQKPYFLQEHIKRLVESARIISLEHEFSEGAIRDGIVELVKQCDTGEAYNIKILLIGAKDPGECLLYAFPSKPLFPDRKHQRDGVSTITVSYQRAFPNAKTLNMLQSYMAFRQARTHDCYDALAVDQDGYITEGTMTNFFLTKDKTIFTSPPDRILDGVTSRIVLDLAIKNGFTVAEKCARVPELADYDGAFLTSTSSKVMPIRRIDSFEFGAVSERVKELGRLYDDFLARCEGRWEES